MRSFGLAAFALACVTLFAPVADAAGMRIAVLEFTNATKDPELAALGKGLQSMVTTDLAVAQTLQVVERDRLKDVQAELSRSQGAGFDQKTAARLGKLVGATHLFVGSYTVVGDQMRLDGRLIDVGTGRVLLAEQIAGEKALFFELEQKLVQKVIGALGVKVLPKEKAVMARPHTADFGAFQKFSEGIQAFDDGRLDEAMRDLTEATAIDKDFKLASLTLEEYERLAAQVRAKAEAAGRVEDEIGRLEKSKALAAEVTVVKKLWQLLDATKGSSVDDKLRRVALLCILSSHYASKLGFQNRGPVSSSDLAAAGFDDFSLRRTSDALFKRAWSEAPEVFPRLPPLCLELHALSSTNPRPIEELIGYKIKDAQKLFDKSDTILSYLSNNATVDPARDRLHLDPPAEVKLWEKLYALSQKLPDLRDADRARFEQEIAERKRKAGDFDGSTQRYAAASRYTKDSYRLKQYAEEIDTNKALKLVVGVGNTPLREYFLLNSSEHPDSLARIAQPKSEQRLRDGLERARDLSIREQILLGDLPIWYLVGPTFGATLRSGPRSSLLRTTELRYEGQVRDEPPREPVIVSTAARGRKIAVKATIDQGAAPAGWRSVSRDPGRAGGEVGVVFASRRLVPDGGIERGTPVLTIAHAVLVGSGAVRLVEITRDGEHRIAVKALASAAIRDAAGKRSLEVKAEPGAVTVTVGGQRVSLPWKIAPADADGYVGFLFAGVGYASIIQPTVVVGGN